MEREREGHGLRQGTSHCGPVAQRFTAEAVLRAILWERGRENARGFAIKTPRWFQQLHVGLDPRPPAARSGPARNRPETDVSRAPARGRTDRQSAVHPRRGL